MEVTGFIDVTSLLRGGVYMLMRRRVVVYIGQSRCLLTRIHTHRANSNRKLPSWLPHSARGIAYDEVHILPVHPDRIDEVERELIRHYAPKYNIVHNSPARGSVPLHDVFPNPRPPAIFRQRL